MDSFRQSRFGGGGNPWFRIGTVDIGSSAFAALAVLVGMVLVAVEGPSLPVSRWLIFFAPDVANGQVWRMLTWFIPNDISLWTLLSAFLIFSFGTHLENTLGRERMAQFLAVLILIPSLVAMALHATGIFDGPLGFSGGSLLSSALFFAFVLTMPNARFFFGIPGWAIAAAFIGIQLLSYLGQRDTGGAVNYLISLFLIVAATNVFGLIDSIPAIPSMGRSPSPGRSSKKRSPKGSDSGTIRTPPATVSELDDERFRALDIDPILDQIAAFGIDSLSSDQRKKLESYSNKNKNKRKRGR